MMFWNGFQGSRGNTDGDDMELIDSVDKLMDAADDEILNDNSMDLERNPKVLSRQSLVDVVKSYVGDGRSSQWMDWIGAPVSDNDQARTEPPLNLDGLEAAIGHKFRERSLLEEAITHASHLSSGVQSYQRLEFVGDAVLDHLITRYFFVSYRDLPPGRLTELRQVTVNNENFARIAVKHNFHMYLQHASSALQSQIDIFVGNIQNELDRPGLNSFGYGDLKAPKVLADILESIAGAVFLDTELDTEKVWQIFEPLLQPFVTPDTMLKHPVSELQERCQHRAELLEYKSFQHDNLAFVVQVYIDGDQIAVAQNSKKKVAQKLAAWNALKVLKEQDLDVEAIVTDNAKESSTVGFSNAQFTRQLPNDGNMNANYMQTLYDLCWSQRWSKPDYKRVMEFGLAHSKKFVYSVRVKMEENSVCEEVAGEAMPSVKRAKDSAAAIMLQSLKTR